MLGVDARVRLGGDFCGMPNCSRGRGLGAAQQKGALLVSAGHRQVEGGPAEGVSGLQGGAPLQVVSHFGGVAVLRRHDHERARLGFLPGRARRRRVLSRVALAAHAEAAHGPVPQGVLSAVFVGAHDALGIALPVQEPPHGEALAAALARGLGPRGRPPELGLEGLVRGDGLGQRVELALGLLDVQLGLGPVLGEAALDLGHFAAVGRRRAVPLLLARLPGKRRRPHLPLQGVGEAVLFG
mmetsp:Transcript_38644/g.86296  ORF Transcript_38644/g.86296 Transcript_38644/m.86296 type:complete len:240 (+) Transcript_38644:170-889(+)